MSPSFRERRRLGWLAVIPILAVLFLFLRWRMDPPVLPPLRFVQAQEEIDSIIFSRDGHLLMTTDAQDHVVTFRDPRTGRIVRQWSGGGGQTWLSDDGTRVLEAASAHDGRTHCALRDAWTGQPVRQWTGRILSVLPDFSRMVMTDDDPPQPASAGGYPGTHAIRAGVMPAEGRVVDMTSGHILGTFALANPWTLRLSGNGRYLCLPDESQPSRLLRVPEMTPVLTLPPLVSLHVSHDGAHAFGIGRDGTLHLWLLPSGQHTAIATGLSGHLGAYTVRNGLLAVAGSEGAGDRQRDVVQIRSADGTRLLCSLPTNSVLSYSPDGSFLGSGIWSVRGRNGLDLTAYDVYDVQTGRRVVRLDTGADPLGQPLSHQPSEQGHLVIAPNGRQFVFATPGGLLCFYDLDAPRPDISHVPVSTDGGRTVMSFPGSNFGVSPLDAVVLPGGGVAAGGGRGPGSEPQPVQVWISEKIRLSVKAAVGNGDVQRLGISPDGRTLVGSSQWGVWILDLASAAAEAAPNAVTTEGTQDFSLAGLGRPVWLNGPGLPVSVVSTDPFGNGAVSRTNWDATAHKISSQTIILADQRVEGHWYHKAQSEVSPDGKVMAVLWNDVTPQKINGKVVDGWFGGGLLELRSTRTGRLLHTLMTARQDAPRWNEHGALGRPAFSSDGKLLAVADDLGGVLIFDTILGRKIGRMSGTTVSNTSRIMAFADDGRGRTALLSFAPGGQLLAAARDDGSIYLYSLRTFLPVAQIGQTGSPSIVDYGKNEPSDVAGYGQADHPLRWMAFDTHESKLYGIAASGTDVRVWDVPKVP